MGEVPCCFVLCEHCCKGLGRALEFLSQVLQICTRTKLCSFMLCGLAVSFYFSYHHQGPASSSHFFLFVQFSRTEHIFCCVQGF